MRALLAAVKLRVAFRAVAAEIRPWRDGRRTVVTPGCGYMLYKAGKPGAGDVYGRAGTLGFRTFAKGFAVAVRVHVPVLSVLAIAVHGERLLRKSPDEMGVTY
jgi:hypothetical protein